MAADSSLALGALLTALPGAALLGDAATIVNGVAYDSREVAPGDLFAALPGGYVDGHDFAAAAIERGAAALLVERPLPIAAPQLIVPDARAALAVAAAELYRHPSRELDVIGITGTDGKTTTSYLTDAIFRAAGRVTGMIGTIAVRIGGEEDRHATRQTTPESAEIQRLLRAMVAAGADWAILEATSHGLAMHRLDGVRFRIGAVTNITHEHLEFHGTIEKYWRAKATLFERVAAAGGRAVVNIDDAGASSVLAYCAGAEALRYSTRGAPADLQAVAIEADERGSRFWLQRGDERARVDLPLLGAFNVENATCAAGIALAAGIPLPAIAAALGQAEPAPGRMAFIDMGQPFGVVVDYAHTPASLAKVLALLRSLYRGRLIVVFGSAGERDVEKRAIQGDVAARLADVAVVTSEDPRYEDAAAIVAQIAAGAIAAGGREGESLYRETDRRAAIALACGLARSDDCVLLAGKGHEGSIIWGGEKLPWNEAETAREILAEMGYNLPQPAHDVARPRRS
ncbi:MAG TPA: UDP-N-acetylmuramoyl-L-alanyl-D-glutamate--2,6-diaminopimelate ligase [Thermomicrobiales bacterium]|nr:UDP-N-acetylmuramoyl-L-alanyl-D-glutamate--2,6-diaminopimelate ligase [Thermomicrobiales bacterium]